MYYIFTFVIFVYHDISKGGAIRSHSTDTYISNSSFSYNSAVIIANDNITTAHGGAIFFLKANPDLKSEIIISETIFESNNAPGRGGAIYSDFLKEKNSTTVDNITIINTLFNGNFIGPNISNSACCPYAGQALAVDFGGILTLKNVNMTGQYTVLDIINLSWWNSTSLSAAGDEPDVAEIVIVNSDIPGMSTYT